MKTLGIDLASAAEKTAWCSVQWSAGAAAVSALQVGADDEALVAAAAAVDHVGVDAPLGWPRAFVRMLQEPPRPFAWPGERNLLRYRETDRFVHRATGLWPLSVSSDLIGVVAMRCRGLLARLSAAGRSCLEVYPAVALHQWRIEPRGYKGPRKRDELGRRVDALCAHAGWLSLSARFEAMVRSSDDAFDALLASLAVRAEVAGHVLDEHRCPDGEAAEEGWIVLPAPGSLPQLANEPA
ncbi:MAG: DUF429 domain-containing protein [Planctomycetota bacterium]